MNALRSTVLLLLSLPTFGPGCDGLPPDDDAPGHLELALAVQDDNHVGEWRLSGTFTIKNSQTGETVRVIEDDGSRTVALIGLRADPYTIELGPKWALEHTVAGEVLDEPGLELVTSGPVGFVIQPGHTSQITFAFRRAQTGALGIGLAIVDQAATLDVMLAFGGQRQGEGAFFEGLESTRAAFTLSCDDLDVTAGPTSIDATRLSCGVLDITTADGAIAAISDALLADLSETSANILLIPPPGGDQNAWQLMLQYNFTPTSDEAALCNISMSGSVDTVIVQDAQGLAVPVPFAIDNGTFSLMCDHGNLASQSRIGGTFALRFRP